MATKFQGQLERIDDYRWRIPVTYKKGMRVPGVIFTSKIMLEDVINDNAPEQVANAAHLPGVVKAAMAMPDIHWGYGLPIGGVLATDIDEGGVITPGGVGYDINCGVRLMNTSLAKDDVMPRMKILIDEIFKNVPVGVGATGNIKISKKQKEGPLTSGAKWAVNNGFGWASDIDLCEEHGAIKGAIPDFVSDKAFERGADQSGTLGSGNHFLEIQEVETIFDPEVSKIMGIEKGRVTVMIHCGSRGLGHQVCSDYASKMVKDSMGAGITVPDRQLACMPVKSREGEEYLGAMRCAANYAWANRQIIMHKTRGAFEKVFGESSSSLGMRMVYDVAHNIAKIEEYDIDGKTRKLCVHRKGATRALPPGHKDVPDRYKKTGQPVIIPGDMGRCSYLLAGARGAEETFYSACHGAGRKMSRSAAKKSTKGRSVARELEDKGITVRYSGRDTLHEEVPEAYKDVNQVVDVVVGAGLSLKVARMRPLGVIKG